MLEEATGELEKLALDVEEAKLALAQGFVSPEGSSNSVLSQLLKFVEHADYLPYWTEDVDARKKGFDRCKAAVIKAVVEVAGDDKNMTVLWDDSQEGKPGGYFVEAMVRWVRDHKDPAVSKRDDLLVCALVNLGNLCRKGASHELLVGTAGSADTSLCRVTFHCPRKRTHLHSSRPCQPYAANYGSQSYAWGSGSAQTFGNIVYFSRCIRPSWSSSPTRDE